MSVHESEKVWLACINSEIYGPMSAIEIRGALSDRRLRSDDPVLKKGWTNWKRLQDIPLFAYGCTQSPGLNRPLPELAVPDADQFSSLIIPKVSSHEIDTHKNWSARRIAVVSGAAIVFGPIGALGATVLTKPSSQARREQKERDQGFIDPKNH